MEDAQRMALAILEQDIELLSNDNAPLRHYLLNQKRKTPWSRIS
jgi:hypothetical protein